MGLYTQQDPIGIAGGLNLYGYANGDPVNFSDPFGLSPTGGCPMCERSAALAAEMAHRAANGDPEGQCFVATMLVPPAVYVDGGGIKAGLGVVKAAASGLASLGRSAAGWLGRAIGRDAEGTLVMSESVMASAREALAAEASQTGKALDAQGMSAARAATTPASVGFDAATAHNQGEDPAKSVLDFTIGLVPGATTVSAVGNARNACSRL